MKNLKNYRLYEMKLDEIIIYVHIKNFRLNVGEKVKMHFVMKCIYWRNKFQHAFSGIIYSLIVRCERSKVNVF